MKLKGIFLVVILTIAGGCAGIFLSRSFHKPVRYDVLIKTRQYSYDPDRIEVHYMDTLHIRLVSMDVVHGFYLEDYDIDAEISPHVKNIKIRHPSEGFIWKDTSEIVLIAAKRGKFRYRCSHTCGNLHPFMQGILIVKPNIMLYTSIGSVLGFLLGMLAMFYIRIRKSG
jgi:heme/copper-type cytochrome/quinol oxidase subunit 2